MSVEVNYLEREIDNTNKEIKDLLKEIGQKKKIRKATKDKDACF